MIKKRPFTGEKGKMNREDLLSYVEKPSRYLGTELNAVHKDEAKVRFALAFPDTYEVGMSHLGIQILYAILNGMDDVAAERCFAPWPDMESLLRRHNLPLASLESRRPLSAFDMVGFSLQYELSYTNVLNMLDLGGIPLLSKDRKASHPIVIAGGPCAFNPAPMSAFIDAFVIGEGEEVIVEIAVLLLNARKKGWKRDDILEALAEIEGIYLPAIHREGGRIKKRIVKDFSELSCPMQPIVPLMKTIHDRITLEIARGCTRGCRFCQAGMVWRPVRERNQALLEGMADSLLCATGYDEISLLSLSSGDYSRIEPLITALMDRYYENRIALALPSLRVETLTRNLMESIRRVRKTSFTLAPEAGTQRLRDIINKGNGEEELLKTVRQVFEAGWKSVKLYFMLGLPSEDKADLEGIAELAYRALKEGRQRGQITVSLSSFVPKAHTPFQWERQITAAEIGEKQAFLKGRIRHRHLSLKWHDGRMSELEGILSRGDAKTGALIEEAFRLGCRFDGWADLFRFDLWEEAMVRRGLSAGQYMGMRDHAEKLPWDSIDCGVEKSFLMEEAGKAKTGELTADCRLGHCHNCGVCDHKTIKITDAATCDAAPTPDTGENSQSTERSPRSQKGSERSAEEFFRIKFIKRARFLAHLEISEALIRAVKRSGITFKYSQGFHPHPRLSFAYATSVGMESREEYADMCIIRQEGEEPLNLEKINAFLPAGLEIVEITRLTGREARLPDAIKGFSYEADLPDVDPSSIAQKIQTFLASEAFSITRETKGKAVARDIRPFVSSIFLEKENRIIFTLLLKKEGTARPMEILTEVLGMETDSARKARIVKTKTLFSIDKRQ